jgi:uncharacterized protein YqcC (DUF446 family)
MDQWWQQNNHIDVLPSVNFHNDTYSPKKKCHLQYIIIPKLKNVFANKKELQEKQKLCSKPTSWDTIAFTQTFDGLVAHMPYFMVDPNGKIDIR